MGKWSITHDPTNGIMVNYPLSHYIIHYSTNWLVTSHDLLTVLDGSTVINMSFSSKVPKHITSKNSKPSKSEVLNALEDL